MKGKAGSRNSGTCSPSRAGPRLGWVHVGNCGNESQNAARPSEPPCLANSCFTPRRSYAFSPGFLGTVSVAEGEPRPNPGPFLS